MKAKGTDLVKLVGYLTIKTYRDGELISETAPMRNKVVSSAGYGRNMILRWMAGDQTYPITIDSASVGNDNTAASDGQTDLISPDVEDIPITNMAVTNNVLAVDVFIADANLPNGTYEEFGLFMGGRMLSRIVISPAYTKGAGEDTLFSYELTLNG